MRSRRHHLLTITALAAAAFGLAGCGSDNSGQSEDERAAEQDVVATIDAFQLARSPERFCGLLTDAGRRYVTANFSGGRAGSCEQHFGREEAAATADTPPKVDPVGVSGDAAVAVIQLGGENAVYTLRRESGRWLIDCPCVVPNQGQLGGEVSNEAKEAANSPAGVEASGRDVTDRPVSEVIAVGDVGLAYHSDSSPELMVRDGNGWHVSPLSLGAP